MNFEKILIITALLLAAFSLINIQWEILPNRWLRLSTSGIFFLVAVQIVNLKKLWGPVIFALFVICDFFLLEWEAMYAKQAYYSLHSLLIVCLIFLTYRQMDWRKVSLFEIGSAIFFILINSYIFLILRKDFNIEGLLLKTLFNVNGFLIVFLVVLSFFYSVNRPNAITSSYFLAVLSLTASELMLFSIYILKMPIFLYVTNLFYIISLFFLLRASLQNKFSEETNLISQEEEDKEKEFSSPDRMTGYS